MDWGYIFLVAFGFGILLIITQRMVDGTPKRMTRGFVVTMALITIAFVYPERREATLVGLFIALMISFLFWLLIGRYNPVAAEGEIKVYGLDD